MKETKTLEIIEDFEYENQSNQENDSDEQLLGGEIWYNQLSDFTFLFHLLSRGSMSYVRRYAPSFFYNNSFLYQELQLLLVYVYIIFEGFARLFRKKVYLCS